MNLRILRRGLGLLAVLLLAHGCGEDSDRKSPTEPAPTTDSLTLASIEPRPGTILRINQRVEIRARLRYSLASKPRGDLSALVFSPDTLAPIFTAPLLPNTALSGGTGEVSLDFSFTVPPGARTVLVTYGLFPEGTSSSDKGVDILYPVVN